MKNLWENIYYEKENSLISNKNLRFKFAALLSKILFEDGKDQPVDKNLNICRRKQEFIQQSDKSKKKKKEDARVWERKESEISDELKRNLL